MTRRATDAFVGIRRASHACRLLVSLLLGVAWTPAFAAAGESLGAFEHTGFSKGEGAPRDSWLLAQDQGGFLWISTLKGVVRFDGVRFDPFKPVGTDHFQQPQLDGIYQAQNGGFWLANQSAGPSLLKNGRIYHDEVRKGFEGTTKNFFADPTGAVWAVSSDAVMKFHDAAWHVVFRKAPGEGLNSGAIDAQGHIWVLKRGQLWVAIDEKGSLIPAVNAPKDIERVFTGLQSGRIYITTATQTLVYRFDGESLKETTEPIPIHVHQVVETRSGAAWMSTEEGVSFAGPGALATAEKTHGPVATERFGKLEGLTGDFAWGVLEDKEGSVWVATTEGVDRFRRASFTSVKLPKGSHSVVSTVDLAGNVWIGPDGMPVMRQERGTASWTRAGPERAASAAFHDDVDGSDWIANNEGVWKLAPGRPELVAPTAGGPAGYDLLCIARDPAGVLYACGVNAASGPVKWEGNRWESILPGREAARVMTVGPDNTLWIGAKSVAALFVIRDGKARKLGTRDGLMANVKSILPSGGGAWVGTDGGVQFFDGSHFRNLRVDRPEILDATTGIVLDRSGALWLQSLDGVLRIDPDEVQRFFDDPGHMVAYQLYTMEDGVPGAPDADMCLPSLILQSDGRIWTHTVSGLAWMDPSQWRRHSQLPGLFVERLVSAKGTQELDAGSVSLSSAEDSFRISYTTPLLERPESVSFAYRLVGYSDTWQDAGTRREATFTGVPGGSYRFEVRASLPGNEGRSEVSALRVVKQLATHETWWFRTLLVLPVLLILWLIYRLRLRSLQRQLRIRMDEREAVARDIHDTLLQRFHGVLLSLKIWAGDERIPEKRRTEMAALSDQTREAMLEGRERILKLRRSSDNALALYDELMVEGRRLEESTGMAFSLEATGLPRQLQDASGHELRDIVVEAMRNAFMHSHGTHVEVRMTFDRNAFWVVVSDDGVGMSEADRTNAPGTGHFGLVGLWERVSRINGTLTIESETDEGTEVHIRLPARVAYTRVSRGKRG